MKKRFRWLKALAVLALLFLVYFFGLLGHGYATDYRPAPTVELPLSGQATANPDPDSSFQLMAWNIGYGGLGAASSFFYHGGGFWSAGTKDVRPPTALHQQYWQGIQAVIQQHEADFYCFQEIDLAAKRSYFTNQFESIGALLPNYTATFAANFKVARVPAPVLQPWKAYGAVHSGIATFSRFPVTAAQRIQLPGQFGWLKQPFQLDRCLAEHRIPLPNGRQLRLFNVHNEAYDRSGAIKAQQLQVLQQLATAAYEAGDYVIACGDWNQSPPFFPANRLRNGGQPGYTPHNIPPDLFPDGWQWIYDPTQPTVRSTSTIYSTADSPVALIDYFLVSPNVQALKVACLNQNFQFSDHQPMQLTFRLKK